MPYCGGFCSSIVASFEFSFKELFSEFSVGTGHDLVNSWNAYPMLLFSSMAAEWETYCVLHDNDYDYDDNRHNEDDENNNDHDWQWWLKMIILMMMNNHNKYNDDNNDYNYDNDE